MHLKFNNLALKQLLIAHNSRKSRTGWDPTMQLLICLRESHQLSFIFLLPYSLFSFFILEETEDCGINWTLLCDILDPYHMDTTLLKWISNSNRWEPQITYLQRSHIIQCSWWADYTSSPATMNAIDWENKSSLPGRCGAKHQSNLPEWEQDISLTFFLLPGLWEEHNTEFPYLFGRGADLSEPNQQWNYTAVAWLNQKYIWPPWRIW
jgi:hypothetical protein